VGEKFPEILEGKVGECFRAHSSTKRDLSGSWIRDLQECDYDKGKCSCICNTQSPYVYDLIGRGLTEKQNFLSLSLSFQSK
jgi:hypothetical protein